MHAVRRRNMPQLEFGESEKDSSVSEFYHFKVQFVSDFELVMFGVVDST